MKHGGQTGLFLVLTLCAFGLSAGQRSSRQKALFIKNNPCPTYNDEQHKCLGFVVDHIVPLCAGGSDTPGNMQWQSIQKAKAKDKEEWRLCRSLRKTSHK